MELTGFDVMYCKVEGLDWAMLRSGNPHRTYFEPMNKENIHARAKTCQNLGQAKPGSGHDCFCKGIRVSFDAYTDQRIHRQLLRYRFVDIVSSMSLEHSWEKILFDPHLMSRVDPLMTEALRAAYQGAKDRDEEPDREWFLNNMPLGVLLGVSFTANYLQLKTIYHQRKNHRHPGWRNFCEEIALLPMFRELVLGEER
jgi:hypothetical protein